MSSTRSAYCSQLCHRDWSLLGFTITDGALRMLERFTSTVSVTAVSIAFLFLFYEFSASSPTCSAAGSRPFRRQSNSFRRTGAANSVLVDAHVVKRALVQTRLGRLCHVRTGAVGNRKDLTKMSSKSAIKVIVPEGGSESVLFKWVARLTGSKNALKGLGFLVGGGLLAAFGFAGALLSMAGALCGAPRRRRIAYWRFRSLKEEDKVHVASIEEPGDQPAFGRPLVSFASRDIWFVVGLPVFLSQLGWSEWSVGAFVALWVIGYGLIQAAVPEILHLLGNETVDGSRRASGLLSSCWSRQVWPWRCVPAPTGPRL